MAAAAGRRDDAPMKSQVAITVSGHVFAYPKVTPAAQDAPPPRVATAA